MGPRRGGASMNQARRLMHERDLGKAASSCAADSGAVPAQYPESNQIHKKMLCTSRRIHAALEEKPPDDQLLHTATSSGVASAIAPTGMASSAGST